MAVIAVRTIALPDRHLLVSDLTDQALGEESDCRVRSSNSCIRSASSSADRRRSPSARSCAACPVILLKGFPDGAGLGVASPGRLFVSVAVLAQDEVLAALAAPLILATAGRLGDSRECPKGSVWFPNGGENHVRCCDRYVLEISVGVSSVMHGWRTAR